MRLMKYIAACTLCAGMALQTARAMPTEVKISAGPQTVAANMDDYRMGYGGVATIAVERQTGFITDSRVGVRGSFLDYRNQRGTPLPDFQEYGIGLEALAGPAGGIFEPKVGAHLGYVRLDGFSNPDREHLLDLGADLMASLRILPALDLQALVTPYWLINTTDTDYHTRGALNLQLSLPGA